MIVKTRIFELCDGDYKNLSELAQAMGISVSQIYRVREGKRRVNQKFIVGAIKAFPNRKLDDLFYLAPETPTVHKHCHQPPATRFTDEPAAKEKQINNEKHSARAGKVYLSYKQVSPVPQEPHLCLHKP